MDAMFRKSLSDLVRGIRAHKKDEEEFINRCIGEIKEELRLVNKKAKMTAVQKLTYLHMLGYDISWAAFNIIEVMSQQQFTAKRIGYLAASQSFTSQTDVLMLATNLFKKDISSANPYESGLAINSLSNVCTPDLARDLAPDLVTLLSSSRPYVRKKAVLVLYKIFLQFPQALRPAFPRLKEKLEDPDLGVVSSAVNVICELARKNPKNYLTLAPILFKILTMSANNWMLIKIIKLFGSLTPLEKRLGKKLVEPITGIMNSTTAMSLLYECIQTCIIGLSAHASIIRLCITKLRIFIEDTDQNLKYLGLLALNKLMKIAPKSVQEHKDTVLVCLNDEDITIRLRALDLIIGMVNKRNITEIVKKLMEKLEDADGNYREELIAKIIDICSQENYKFLSDFEWYISVLVELTHVHGTKHGKRISDQLMDVCIRVKIIREYGVTSMVNLLHESRLTEENPTEDGICEVIYAAAWIVGEFAEYASSHCDLLDTLLQPRLSILPGHIQAVCIQNSIKVFTYILNHPSTESPIEKALDIMQSRLPLFTKSSDLETQERACFALELIKLVAAVGGSLASELAELFAEPLNPVAEKAQRKVPVPPGLDLDQQIHTPPPSDSESSEEEADVSWGTATMEKSKVVSPETRDAERKRAAERRMNDPFYLGSGGKLLDEEEEYPVVETISSDILRGPQTPVTKKPIKRKNIQIITAEEMPEGADSSDDEPTGRQGEDIFSGIDLETSLRPGEELQSAAYPLPSVSYGGHAEPQQEEGRKRRRRKRGEGKETGDRKERRRRKDKEGKKTSEPNLLDLNSPTHGKEPVPAPQAAPAPASVPANIVLAADNTEVKLAYELGINPQQPDKFMVMFHIRAVKNTLSALQFQLDSNDALQLVQPAEMGPSFQIAANTHNSHRFLFQFRRLSQPQRVSGSLGYHTVESGGNGKLRFEVAVPCSSFVQNIPISQSEFEGMVDTLASATSKIRCSDAKAGLNAIKNTIHVTEVGITDKALLYGRSIQGHNVCILVERKSGGFIVTVKCEDETLGASLLSEIKAALKSLPGK